MNVADSSYIVDRLVRERGDFVDEECLAPDFVVPEVVNAILVQQETLHILADGKPYVRALFEAIDADSLKLVVVSQPLVESALDIAVRNGEAIYDSIFVALALEHGDGLKTIDRKQAQVYENELRRGRGKGPRSDGMGHD